MPFQVSYMCLRAKGEWLKLKQICIAAAQSKLQTCLAYSLACECKGSGFKGVKGYQYLCWCKHANESALASRGAQRWGGDRPESVCIGTRPQTLTMVSAVRHSYTRQQTLCPGPSTWCLTMPQKGMSPQACRERVQHTWKLPDMLHLRCWHHLQSWHCRSWTYPPQGYCPYPPWGLSASVVTALCHALQQPRSCAALGHPL